MAYYDDRAWKSATIAAADIYTAGATTALDVIHTTMMTFSAMAFDDRRGGIIDTAVIKINNDNTTEITGALKLHLFTNSGLSAQTKGDPFTLTSTDIESALPTISITPVKIKDYISWGISRCRVPYITATNDLSLYGYITCDSAITFDASASIIVDLHIVRD